MLRVVRFAFNRRKDKFSDFQWSYIQDIDKYFNPLFRFRPYEEKVSFWKKPLETSQRLKANAKANNQLKGVAAPEPPKLVIHDPGRGITLPPPQDKIFFIAKIGNSLHKLTHGSTLALRNFKLLEQPGEQLILTDVRMVGTTDFTLLGRPAVEAQARLRVLEKSLSRKLIVFKKKRRKQYKWNMGWREELVVLQVEALDFQLSQEMLAASVPLI